MSNKSKCDCIFRFKTSMSNASFYIGWKSMPFFSKETYDMNETSIQFFFFHLITALSFPLQNLVQRLRCQTPSSVSGPPAKFRQSLSNFSAIPCELFGNTLRALFLKNRDFLWYKEIVLPNTSVMPNRVIEFWSSRPKTCGAN